MNFHSKLKIFFIFYDEVAAFRVGTAQESFFVIGGVVVGARRLASVTAPERVVLDRGYVGLLQNEVCLREDLLSFRTELLDLENIDFLIFFEIIVRRGVDITVSSVSASSKDAKVFVCRWNPQEPGWHFSM